MNYDSEPITWAELKAHRPSDAERDARAADLVRRARAVRRDGWEDYRHVWSSGEVAGVAYLIGDQAVLADASETEESVLSRYAGDLFGIEGGAADTAAGSPATLLWFDAAYRQL